MEDIIEFSEVKKESNATIFKKKHGYSVTFSKLMVKYSCKTPADYRALRKINRKNKTKTKTVSKPSVPVSAQTSKNKKK